MRSTIYDVIKKLSRSKTRDENKRMKNWKHFVIAISHFVVCKQQGITSKLHSCVIGSDSHSISRKQCRLSFSASTFSHALSTTDSLLITILHDYLAVEIFSMKTQNWIETNLTKTHFRVFNAKAVESRETTNERSKRNCKQIILLFMRS